MQKKEGGGKNINTKSTSAKHFPSYGQKDQFLNMQQSEQSAGPGLRKVYIQILFLVFTSCVVLDKSLIFYELALVFSSKVLPVLKL